MSSTPAALANAPSKHDPLLFEEFFEFGQEETHSPFITHDSRKYGADLTLRASILSAFLLVCAFGLSQYPRTENLGYILLTFVYLLSGIPSLIESIEDLLDFDVNIDILMTLAAFSSVLIGSAFEGALLLVLFALSGAMEDAVTSKAKGSLSRLHRLSPTLACVIDEDGTLIERAVKEIPVGTTILVKANQVVPLDGKVLEGASSVNLVHLTGENFPLRKGPGDEVAAGARNLEGSLTLEVLRTSADSTLTKIIKLVTEAQEARPALQRWFDKLSRGYAIAIILLFALFAAAMPFFLAIPWLGREGSIYRSLAFLIAASPCALIIALPIAYLSAISACARKGILLKGGITLDALASCHSVAFDKTGTLTTGELTCENVELIEGNASSEEAIGAAYGLEKNTVHPIAGAITALAQSRKVPGLKIEEFKSVPGYGLEGLVITPAGEKKKAYLGNPDHIQGNIGPAAQSLLSERVARLTRSGRLIAVLLLGDSLFLFSFTDTVRPNIANTVKQVKDMGWSVVMLTGDNAGSAERIAGELGIPEFYANLKPEDKLRHVNKLANERGLAMIGDGVNDAPALARATVGIGMGKVGSSAAIDAADIVLLQDNIDNLGWLIQKAAKTQVILKQNLMLAIAAIVLASAPALGGLIPLWLAVIFHEGGTVLVGLNALRLLRN